MQFTLLVASEQDDFFDRNLGSIHLIKYAYLADLEYSKHKGGKTYTGVDWRFYKFGPWSETVYNRIEPALTAIGADKKVFQSDYEDKDEWVRWEAKDDTMLPEIERSLPVIVVAAIRNYVRKFGKDTPGLLSFVYSTPPMLNAAPLEFLDFSTAIENQDPSQSDTDRTVRLSAKKRKLLKQKMLELKRSFADRLQSRRRSEQSVKPHFEPRYDDVYFEGLAWLDSLAGDPIPLGEIEVEFSDSIWKSPARTGDDVSC